MRVEGITPNIYYVTNPVAKLDWRSISVMSTAANSASGTLNLANNRTDQHWHLSLAMILMTLIGHYQTLLFPM
jgi:hypothetical protein